MATRDTYGMQIWENKPQETTPVNAERLSHIEQGIKDAADKRALKEIYDDDAINLGRKAGTTAGYLSTAEGMGTTADGLCSHAEGSSTTAGGAKSHAEGEETIAGGYCSHAEGCQTFAEGTRSHAEGDSTVARGAGSHAEGYNTKTYGSFCHAERYSTVSGSETNTYANSSHAEGIDTKATGNAAHAEGIRTTSSGEGSHAEGIDTTQLNQYARAVHMEGMGTQAVEDAQHVGGKYNVPASNHAVIIGGGTSDSERKNIFMLDWQGNAVFAGNIIGTYNGKTISLVGLQMEMEGKFSSLANGIMPAKVFDTKAELDEWITEENNAESLKVGQNIFIVETGSPDYWWDGTGLQAIEADKVEFMTYDETMAILNEKAEEVA